MQNRLPYKKEVFRLWFEFLRLARRSGNAGVRDALKRSNEFYAPWGAVESVSFNEWWKLKGAIFEETLSVKEVERTKIPTDPDIILIQVPLNQSLTKLTTNIKLVLRNAIRLRNVKARKGTRASSVTYRLSDGAEPKLAAIREMLNVYRDVYLKNRKLRGEKLLRAAQSYYTTRRNKKWAKVPYSLQDGDGEKIRTMRNLRRYIQHAEKIILNVANGSFPGRY